MREVLLARVLAVKELEMKHNDGMSEKRAERVIEQFENGSRNSEEWAHNVCLHRGTDRYEQSLLILNEAFKIKNSDRQIQPLPFEKGATPIRKRTRR